MELLDIVNEIKNKKFKCQINGVENTCKILKIDFELDTAYVKLDNKVIRTEKKLEPSFFGNTEAEYGFVEHKKEVDELWIKIS